MGTVAIVTKPGKKRGRKGKNKPSVGAGSSDRCRALVVCKRKSSPRGHLDYAGCYPTRGYTPPVAPSAPLSETVTVHVSPIYNYGSELDASREEFFKWMATHRIGYRLRANKYLAWMGAGRRDVNALAELAFETLSLWVIELEEGTPRDRALAKSVRDRLALVGYSDLIDTTTGAVHVTFDDMRDALEMTGGRVEERALPSENPMVLQVQIERHLAGKPTSLMSNDTRYTPAGK